VKFDNYYPKCTVLPLLLILILIGSKLNAVTPNASAQTNARTCVQYDGHQKLIHIRCKSIHLSDIYQNLNNASILNLENSTDSKEESSNGKVWILNAGITIEKYGGLIIDSTDTSWLKIVPTPTIQQAKQLVPLVKENDSDTYGEEEEAKDTAPTPISTESKSNIINSTKEEKAILVSNNNANNPNGIHVHGSLKIDSVKITSWDLEKNNVIGFAFGKRAGEELTKSAYDIAEPRAFIRVSKDATGTTNITNSELAYLGYSCSKCSGLSYYGGEDSIIKGNDIHHLLKGFYSNNMGNMAIEENKFHHNYLYGVDPHTGTHDFVIRNNKVHNNNASAIMCSKHCYNILMEGNEIYNNVERGIAFSINTTHSTARNNYVHDESICIGSNRGSDHNKIYNNRISDCGVGVDLGDASDIILNDNIIKNVNDGIVIRNVTNKVENNRITNANNGIVFIDDPASRYRKTINPDHVPVDSDNYKYFLASMEKNNLFSNTANQTIKALPVNDTIKFQHIDKQNGKSID
jgi:mannuronan 5-epimerase